VHIVGDGEKGEESKDELTEVWGKYIELPARHAGLKPPELVVLRSPYRLVLTPILEYIMELEPLPGPASRSARPRTG